VTHNYPADPDYENTSTGDGADRPPLGEGEHTCRIVECKVVFSEKQGEDFLVIEIEDVHSDAGATLWQSFAKDRLKWLKKVCDVIFNPAPRGRDEIRGRASEVVGDIVSVNTARNGQYLNHYINSVLTRHEPAAEVSDDEIPF
jgi:hypothetical protein